MTDDLKTLIDEVDVCGYKVRPWGIVQIAALAPAFERIVNKMKTRGVKLPDILNGIRDKTFVGIDGIIFSVLPEAPEIIAKTLKIDLAEVEKIPQSSVMPIVLTILNQNILYLKNWLGPLLTMTKAVAENTSAT
jgi:hypothetical protein